ncbi:hypothetical protein FGO68_gene13813 [Halteria grandinella]|uniref:Echinoderm microtubule-associated protein-like 6 n=1 Tax=Halteria grandinella TaxID=5974 RepID=A0A8J8P8H1_HALGN|nr:hypothetical protein FGO68_gene13813 [Halteria grandinella]
MSVKPWLGVVKNTVPSTYKYHQSQITEPDASLQLEYIHGYRCHDCRNNLRYTSTGEIVYHAAAAGVVLNQVTNEQRFFIQHTDDIISMALDPTGRYCATGQLGPKPSIFIWDTQSMDLIATASGTLTKGIKQLAFSPDGNFLAATAFDDDHCIAIYQWAQQLKPGQTLKPNASGKGSRAVSLSIGFTPDSKTHLIVTGVKEVNFVSFSTGTLKSQRGQGLTDTSVLCQAFIGQTLYTGLLTGEIGIWNGNSMKSTIKAHTEGCHAIYARANNKGLITGGGDGCVTLWSISPQGLVAQRQLNLKDKTLLNSMIPKVRSVCEGANGTLLIGTRGGEIVEIDQSNKAKFCLRSHHEKELWGVATNPVKDEYVTVGQDMILAIWDLKQRKQRRFSRLTQEANVVAYSNNGKLLVIGMINGEVIWLDAESLTQKNKAKPTDKEITVIKFSPDDSICAIGTSDAKIVQYNASTFKGIINFKKHSSRILHCDWSLDGNFLMSMCTSYNLLFSEARTGKHITTCSQFKDEKWSTWTCTLGWPVQGIWPPNADGSDINSVDRSPDGTTIATADDFGIVKLFRYPCPVEKVASFKKYLGHSSHVTSVRFMKNAPYVITTGGEDKCIFQWKYQMKQAETVTVKKTMNLTLTSSANTKTVKVQQIVNDDEDDGFETEVVGAGDQSIAPGKPAAVIPQHQISDFDYVRPESLKDKIKQETTIKAELPIQPSPSKAALKTTDDVSKSKQTKPTDQVLPKKPAHIRTPSQPPKPQSAGRFNTNPRASGPTTMRDPKNEKVRKNQNLGAITQSKPLKYDKANPNKGEKPQATLKLKYAHGYRSFDTRHNLKFISENEIVFTTAALGVVMDLQADTQRFFNLHEEDVVCLDIHPTKQFAATANMAEKGQRYTDIYVWDVRTLEACARLNTYHEKSVRQVAFSPNGSKLLTIGTDNQNPAAIYDWANQTMLCSGFIDREVVFDCHWKDEKEFVTCGKTHIKIHQIEGRNLVSTMCIGVTIGTWILSCHFAFTEKLLLAGSQTGELLRFQGTSLSGKPIPGHTNGLWVLKTITDSTTKNEVLISGGNDGMVYFWDKNLTKLAKCINLTSMSQFKEIGVRAIDYHQQTGRFIVGTRGAEIIEIGTNCQQIKTHINGHYDYSKDARLPQSEVWGLAVHPKKQLFASCGADHTIRIWDEKNMVQASDPAQFLHDLCSLDWAASGKFLVAGDRNGYVFLIDAETLAILDKKGSQKAGLENAWIEDVKISPCGGYVAFGTHGGVSLIDVVQIAPDGKKFKNNFTIDSKISSAVTHLDWSQDSQNIMINSQAHELTWVNVQTRRTIDASMTREIEFQTWTSIWGYTVHGIWPAGADFTDVNSVCRSHDQTLLISGDDFGKVKLFKYPCWKERALNYAYRGHSSHVTEVKFTVDDRLVVSAGGQDKTVLVWEVDYGAGGRKVLGDDEEEEYVFAQVASEDIQQVKPKPKVSKVIIGGAGVADDGFEVETAGSGDQSIAPTLTAWKTQTMPPTWFKKPSVNQGKKPQVSMDLEWVHGFNSNHIGLMADSSIIYHAASVGIKLSQDGTTQQFFTGHNNEITAIAFSHDRKWAATGDSKSGMCVWNGMDMTLKNKFKGPNMNGILALSFSPSGNFLVALLADEDHTVAYYDLVKNACKLTDTLGKDQINSIAMRDDTSFGTAGVIHFKFWTVKDNTLSFKKGTFGKHDPRLSPCASLTPTRFLTGAITGELYVWKETAEVYQCLKLHERPIDTIHVNGQYVFTGSRDMRVQVLKNDEAKGLSPVYNFTVNELRWKSLCGRVKALCYDEKAMMLYIGTQGAEVFQVPLSLGGAQVKMGQPKIMVQGHYSHPASTGTDLKGLTMHTKNESLFVTAGEDCTLRVWDIATKKQVHCTSLLKDARGNVLVVDANQGIPPSCQCQSLDMSPDGRSLLLAFKDGTLRIYGTTSWDSMDKPIQPPSSTLPLPLVKFSPCGLFYAAASLDTRVFIFSMKGKDVYKPKHLLTKSTLPVCALDWSMDSQYLHTADQGGEVLYYKSSNGQADVSGRSACKDEQWATWSMQIGWPVTGVQQDGVQCVDRFITEGNEGIVSVGMTNGGVRLYRYPSVVENSEWVEGLGKHRETTNAKFSKNGKTLITTGSDNSIFQWKLTYL